jgi:hypothetical protein
LFIVIKHGLKNDKVKFEFCFVKPQPNGSYELLKGWN